MRKNWSVFERLQGGNNRGKDFKKMLLNQPATLEGLRKFRKFITGHKEIDSKHVCLQDLE